MDFEQRLQATEKALKEKQSKIVLTHPNNPNVSFMIELDEKGNVSTKMVETTVTKTENEIPFISFEKEEIQETTTTKKQ